jgi:hypothetical protein
MLLFKVKLSIPVKNPRGVTLRPQYVIVLVDVQIRQITKFNRLVQMQTP